jgi:hypothetical protein
MRALIEAVKLVGLALLMGFTLGTGIVLQDLSEFSDLPSALMWLFPLVAGAFIGALIPSLSRALAALLLMIAIGAGMSALALSYPEYVVGRLGQEIAFELSLVTSLRGVVIAAPLSIVGLLLGKLISPSGE